MHMPTLKSHEQIIVLKKKKVAKNEMIFSF